MSDEPVSTGDQVPAESEPDDQTTTAAASGVASPDLGVEQPAENSQAVDADASDTVADAAGSPSPEQADSQSPDLTGDVPPADLPAEEAASEEVADDDEAEEEESVGNVGPIELIEEEEDESEIKTNWYILKVQVNRETTICDALQRRVKVAGLDRYFGEVVVPTEDVVEFTKSGKRRTVKRKLYPGYIVVDMAINDDTWFLVRETPGIGDFTGSAGKPTPMLPHEVDRIISKPGDDEEEGPKKMAIPFSTGDRVRVKDGYFQNFEGDVEVVDEANGRITVMINIFGRSTPVELEHWQVEAM